MLEKHCFDYERYVNPPIKLFHDAGESMDDMKKKKGFIKNHHSGKCVFCWCLINTLPFTGVCKEM